MDVALAAPPPQCFWPTVARPMHRMSSEQPVGECILSPGPLFATRQRSFVSPPYGKRASRHLLNNIMSAHWLSTRQQSILI